MFDKLKWEMYVWLQNKDESFSMYISCIKDEVWLWNCPYLRVIQCGISEMAEDLDNAPILHSNRFPPPFRPFVFLSTYRLCLLRRNRCLRILCVSSLMVWSMNLIINTPPNSHEVSGTSYVSQLHDICDVNLFANRNTDRLSHYWNTAHGQLRPI